MPRRRNRQNLSADDQRICLWRRPGPRSDPAFVVENHTAITQGVTTCGEICWDTQSPLIALQDTLTARSYVDEILRPVKLSMLSSHPGAIYQQDSFRAHTARLSLPAMSSRI
ncbi:HTH_Tnp_Tc3_2 domain-containing protein [Trichonephila clavipes]|nr:HTH_Tnp_Tc3_2 domain-containing protein [Trichonephila clavipes]